MSKYDDMLYLPHHVSVTHPHMPRADRAAQFAPFAALTGYEDVIGETARLTDARAEQDESRLAELDGQLRALAADGNAEVTIVYFVADAKKAGGRYESHTGKIRKIDGALRQIVMADGVKIALNDVVEIAEAGGGSEI